MRHGILRNACRLASDILTRYGRCVHCMHPPLITMHGHLARQRVVCLAAQRSCSTVTRWRLFTQLFVAAIRCPDYTRLRGCLLDMSIKGCDTSVPGLIQHYSRTCSRLHGKFRCFPYITYLFALLSLTLACIAAPISLGLEGI